MGKRLDITPKIATAIARSTDNSVDPNTVAVFETIALNTLPLNKRGGLFDKATTSEITLRQMADFLNTGTNFVPLHLLHDQGENLPVGRAFAGDVFVTANGITELRVLFYLPLNAEDLITKLDTGVIDEVSVGLKTQHINCSECGWDYLSPEASFENIWTRTCNNGHEIGVDGVHTILNGMERFFELSLVSLGAANNAKILSRTKSLLGEASYNQQLAASGIHPEVTILFASPTHKPKEASMDMTQLIAELTTAKANDQVKTAELTAAKLATDALTAENTKLKEEVVALKASAAPAEVTAQLAKTKEDLVAALAYTRTEADRLAVAAGLEKPAADADLATLTASISTARTKLTQEIPTGGSMNQGQPESTGAQTTAPSAFKTR